MKEFMLLGAGFSYECGMPLVWEFTHVIKRELLKRIDSRLFDFKGDSEFKAYFISLLKEDDLHYEQIVSVLENKLNEHNHEYIHGVILQFVECIQSLLFQENMRVSKLIKSKFKDYSGIVEFLNGEKVVDVYSLNHDLIFEELCNFYSLPYRDCFYEGRETNYDSITKFAMIRRDELEHGSFNLFNNDEYGFNLIKLHGSVDIFAVNDKNIYLKCRELHHRFGGCIDSVKELENKGIETIKIRNVRGVNEILVNDSSGELQFMRRSLLSGGHKFRDREEQIAPFAFLNCFRDRIHKKEHGVAIGYSFNDNHINDILIDWLGNSSNRLTIFDPYCLKVPDSMVKFSEQIDIINSGTNGFFNSFNGKKSNKRYIFKQALREGLKKLRLKE